MIETIILGGCFIILGLILFYTGVVANRLTAKLKSGEKEITSLKETIDHLSTQNQGLQETVWILEEEADDQKSRFRRLLDETEYTINVLQGEILVLSILNKD